ncbi:GntP family permease [Desulfitibacter alkalitolerans]|uniref:GntP family permease n=1 Tax=Desulfitibacter alkalitolerans TaxID=264641 RepID=UPI00047FC6C6|nr:gluconate:H+ symporter [Desulfitibacter alkalitolerans]
MSGPLLLAIIVVMILFLILLVSKVRLHAFLALIITSILMGLLTGHSPLEVVNAVTQGFGGLMTYIGIVIALGVIIGEILESTGASEKIAKSVLRVVGKNRSPLAMGITGGIVSVPVFCDSGFVILSPIFRAISRVGKVPVMTLSAALMAGLLTTHVFVPPTPGPIAAAGILGADLGKVVLYGIIVSIPTILVAVMWANSKFIRNKFPRFITEDDVAQPTTEESKVKTPSTFMSYVPIVVPIVLIIAQSFANQLLADDSSIRGLLAFIGHPAIALLIGTGIAFTMAPNTEEVRDQWVGRALERATVILMVTGAAGSFGRVLAMTGVGEYLGGVISAWGIPGVLLPFLIAAFILTAQGSATVAITTTAAILAPMLPSLGISPELAVLAIGAGAVTVVHANGSYFWVVTKFSGMSITEGYWAVTATTLVMGITGIISVLILSMFV